jgi:hypothetical protein
LLLSYLGRWQVCGHISALHAFSVSSLNPTFISETPLIRGILKFIQVLQTLWERPSPIDDTPPPWNMKRTRSRTRYNI